MPPVPDSAMQRSTSARRCEFGSVPVVRAVEMAVSAASFAAFAVSRSTEYGSPRRTRITRHRRLLGSRDLSGRLGADEVTWVVKTHSAVDLPLVCGPQSAQYVAVVHARMAHLALIGLRRGNLAGMRWKAIELGVGRIPVAELSRDRATGRNIDQRTARPRTGTAAR